MRIVSERASRPWFRVPSTLRPMLAAGVLAMTADLAAAPGVFSAGTKVLPVNERAVGGEAAPTVLVADDGDFVVLFHRRGADGRRSLFGRAYLADGTPRRDGEFRIAEDRSGDQELVGAVADARGRFVVAWDSGDLSGRDVFVRAFEKDGTPRLGPETRVNETTPRDQQGAYLAAAPNGDFVVVWNGDSQAGDGSGVYCRAFLADGTPRSGERALGLAGSGYDVPFGLAVDARGDFVVGFVERADVEAEGVVYTRAFDADGSPKASGAQRAGGVRPGFVFFAQLDGNAAGDYVVSWQNSLGPRSFARAYSRDGLPKRANERRLSAVETRHEVNPRISIDESGGFVAAWQTDGSDGNDTEIYARRFDADGEPVDDPEFIVNASTSGLQDLRAVQRLTSGDVAVAWTTAFSDSLADDGAYVRSFDGNGRSKESGEQRVASFSSIIDGGSGLPKLLRAPAGGFAVVFGDGMPRFRAYDAKGLPRGPVVRVDDGGAPVTATPSARFDRDGDLAFAWAADGVNVRRFGGAHPVDLRVTARDLGDPVPPGGTFQYVFDVTNEHEVVEYAATGVADGVRLDVDLPEGVPLLGVEAPGWTCRTRDELVSCAADGPLEAGASAAVRLELRAPQDAGRSLSATATVTADQFDPDEAASDSGNTVREVTPVVTEPTGG
ncbi:MAG TPA: hypothetical protein VJM11_01275 [Nevskiaceae bacterium]|nr:hypothetical protein [Nevskiaceae bacterium]